MTVIEQRAYEAIIAMAKKNEPDYWEKLRHQAAISAMQGIWNNPTLLEKLIERAEDKEDVYLNIAEKSIACATAFVKKLKEEK